ncbi:MAG: DsbA family protein [Gammaproteobacteria bacterium]|nr:DsbA family protein [Gammaproteobacteria bacterium]
MSETVRFYFSFRSTFSWFAYHRLQRAGGDLPVDLEKIPLFPPTDFNAGRHPGKQPYARLDAERIAAAYGLTLKWPEPYDIDWIRPHSAFLHALENGKGDEFALRAFAARYTQTANIADAPVLRSIADGCGLDGAAIVSAAADADYHAQVLHGMQRGLADGVFGVPFFFYGEQKFWGNDRLEWLVRAVRTDLGLTTPDLADDPWLRPF